MLSWKQFNRIKMYNMYTQRFRFYHSVDNKVLLYSVLLVIPVPQNALYFKIQDKRTAS